MAIVLGLDLSTQSATALVLDTVKGTTVARARAAFGADFPDRGHPEGFLRGGKGGEVHADPLLWLERALVVLVAASPCALAISLAPVL